MSDEAPPQAGGSPRWGSNTKLIIGLTVVAMMAALFIYFRTIIGPLLLAFILAYLYQPIAARLNSSLHLPWRTSVNLIYILTLILLVGVVTIAGLALIQQAQSLIIFVDNFIQDLPQLVNNLATQTYMIGPFPLDFSQFDLQAAVQQLLGMVQPLVGQAGNLVARFAASAATTIGWALFILLVSYFMLSESGRVREDLVRIEIPGYNADSQRLISELTHIWDAFLRGQLLISFLIVVSYYVLLTILGTRLSMVIALMAGIAAFIPYIGPLITWIITAIIAYLQAGNYFGLDPAVYAILVLGCCLALNQVFDSYITPRIMGHTLGVHPAGVLIAAIIATDLIGLVGLVLAAPVLATVTLLGRYIIRKMLDMDPWPPVKVKPRVTVSIWLRLARRFQAISRWLRSRWG
jgi:predicted PurR-regulated permease PerM